MSGTRHILITGASSGIGAALARAYAEHGVRLALTGRDSARLASVAETCRAAGAAVETAALDITDEAAVADWVEGQDRIAPLDLVIANAGISAGTGGRTESATQARNIFATNLGGVINTVQPAARLMMARRAGQIAVMSSLASFRGLPGAPAYCASKAAVRIYGEALGASLARRDVAVSIICPGFVRTPMTEVNRFPMPFLMDAEHAAAIIKRGLARRRPRIAFPLRLYAIVRLLAALPPALTDRWLAKLPAKD